MGMTAAIAMMAGGTAVTAYGQYQAGKANQKIANYNAEVAELQAEQALKRGREDESRLRMQTRQTIGAQRAALAAMGIDLDDGTAAQIQDDTTYFGELDALTIRNNAALEAWGYRTQATDYRMQGSLAASQGRSQMLGTILSAGGQALFMSRRPTAQQGQGER